METFMNLHHLILHKNTWLKGMTRINVEEANKNNKITQRNAS